MEAHPAKAAIFNYNFDVNVTSGPLTGETGSGSFTFDTSLPSEVFGFYRVTDFTFSFLNKTYGTNDLQLSYRGRPLSGVTFSGGERGLTEFVIPFSGCSDVGTCDSNIVILNENFLYEPRPLSANERSSGKVTYTQVLPPTSVPEPSTALGVGILGLGLFLKKKIASSSKRVA